MLSGALSWSLCLLLLRVQAFNATTPRWGQAVALFNNSLFVHGGKTDQYNAYSYTSAPNTNDLLYLPLTSSFSSASPPWTLVSNAPTNSLILQGPCLAWHTLSPSNPSNVLLFGGDPDTNSATVVMTAADSAELLNVTSPLQPVWYMEPTSWAGEPVRRMRHSTATSSSGQVFIIGGELADGSGNALSDHYVYNPTIPSFTLLPSNGPPDIYGHASIMLSDGRLLVFGGYSPSQGTLLPFSTIWILDCSQSNLAWTVIQTFTNLLPSPRMAFAAASLGDGGILIHGGSDSSLENNFADGWILNTSQSTMSWTQIEALSRLGARRDHFAAGQGDQVLFGFGYGENGPASAALQIFNCSSQSFVSLFTPLPSTQTDPTSSQTGKSANPTSRPPSSTSSSTSSADPNSSSTSSSSSPDGGPNGGPNGGSNGGPNASSSSRTRTVAISTALGALAFIIILLGAAYYLRRRRQGQGDSRFIALGTDERDEGADSPRFDGPIPAVRMNGDPVMDTHRGNRRLLCSLGLSGALGVATKMKNVGDGYQRRDMLADEDTRSFGEWYASGGKEGTEGSSWSLKSILGGGSRLLSREASITSRGTNTGGRNTPWREQSDSFVDGTSSLLRDEETGFMGIATATVPSRPRGPRQITHRSSISGLNYRDPFSDSVQEERRERSDANDPLLDGEEKAEIHDPLRISVRHVPAFPPLTTRLPLSPLSEYISQHTSSIPESNTTTSLHAHSSETVITPFGGSLSPNTSGTSVDPVSTSSAIIGSTMRRTDSWWTRFTRTTLLDRKLSNASKVSPAGGMIEIRDPKPPPRLDAISENIRSVLKGSLSSQEEPLPQQQQEGPIFSMASKIYGTGHGKSMSSLRTVDTEAIERIAGTMDVFQRIQTRSNSRMTNRNSSGGMSIDSRRSSLDAGYEGHVNREEASQQPILLSTSPVEMLPLQSPSTHIGSSKLSPRLSSPPSRVSQSRIAPTPSSSIRGVSIHPVVSLRPLPPKSSSTSPSSPSVADRIQAFERRMSLEQTSSPPATNTKYLEERTKKKLTVDYGLVPRASLFVANPDAHRSSTTSGDS